MASHQFNLNFSKSWSEDKGVTYHVSTEDDRWKELALHLTNSSFENTYSLLEVLNQTVDFRSTEEQWRELPGSGVLISSDSNSAKFGTSTVSVDELRDLLGEWLSFTHPFSVENEVAKVSKYLMLPITQIIFDNRFSLSEPYVDENWNFIKLEAKLYIQQNYIGKIPYMIGNFGPMYDAGERELIDWERIAGLFKLELSAGILKQEPAVGSIESKSYGMLLVKDRNGKAINLACCQYIDNQWQINLIGLDSELKTKSVSVMLKVPLPSNL